ncbi:Type V secretory pathway, adhesin AidA [Burkholderia pseudomallei]|nr:Type V secretory pathway, adhesin AidA [Burkholderia pseudomallei]
MLKQQGQRCVDCIIMVDTPYSLQFTQDGSQQTGHAKLKTLVDIVNAVTSEPHTIPELAELMIDSAHSCGRAGQNWSKTQGKRPDKGGKHWITFDERDNRGKVYLYFCPEDTVVGLDKVRGIGTFGVPDEVPADGAAASRGKTMPAMTVLEPKRFFQRMWTRLERDQDGRGKRSKVAVGTPPARVPVRDPFQRLTPGPDTDGTMLGTLVESGKNMALQASFKRNDIRFINGEQLKPAYEPDLYGGEVQKGGQVPGHADVAGLMRPDDVTKNVALGNQYAKFKWKDVATTDDPGAGIEPHKQAFNRGRPVDEQSHNWRIVPSRSLGSMLSAAATGGRYQTYVIQREETPDEVRKRMRTDADQLEANNYHSGVLLSSENHRWVTAMDVAIGQAVTLDDPDWRRLLLLMADWKMTPDAMDKIAKCNAYGRLETHTREFIDACAKYYQNGSFPAEKFVPLTLPPLVTSELKVDKRA